MHICVYNAIKIDVEEKKARKKKLKEGEINYITIAMNMCICAVT
jgi:hypothetical protein